MNELTRFTQQFPFRMDRHRYIGVERERFLAGSNGAFAPRSQEFLVAINNPAWTYELSACQVEDRTDPLYCENEILANLQRNDEQGNNVARMLGLRIATHEVAPEDMPLDVYPDPRYLEIVKRMDPVRLAAACRVTGTHIHVGVDSMADAISVHNALAGRIDELAKLGDHSGGRRLSLYREVAKSWRPPQYKNAQHFFETARAEGFEKNPRDCWHMVRITKHGTVECRMFGATEDPEEVMVWVQRVREIARSLPGLAGQ